MRQWMKMAVQGAACGLVMGVTLLVGGRRWQPPRAVAEEAQPEVVDVLRLKCFEVVDDAGTPRARLEMTEEGGVGLCMLDGKGKMRVWLKVSKEGEPSLDFFDSAGNMPAAWLVSDRGSAILMSETGKPRVRLSLTDGLAELELRDAKANAHGLLKANRLETTNADGKFSWPK